MAKLFFSLFTIIVFSLKLYADSPQVPDYIIFESDTIPVYSLLVEQYLDNFQKENNGELFGLKFRENATTYCWRGYQAVYEIDNDSLFVRHIISCGELFGGNKLDTEKSNKRLRTFFKNKVKKNKVFVDWFSGNLNLPEKNLLRWDGVFVKTFEEETLIKIKKGEVTNISQIQNYIDNPKRINRKYDDSVSKILYKELQKIDWNNNRNFDCSEEYLITIGRSGKVCKVIMYAYQTKDEIEKYWDKKEYNYCVRKVRKGLRNLRFDILKLKGKPIEEQYHLDIWIEESGKLEEWTDY